MDVAQLTQEMERRFGSDKALGVYFVTDDDETLTLEQFDAMFEKLGRDGMPGTQSMLPGGGSAICCTEYACHIFRELPGRVQIFGFANTDNPTSRIAREEIHPGGHDFAIVDGRFIVDPWPRLVPLAFEQMVFDLENPVDVAFVADVYGPRECWRHMPDSQDYALEQDTETAS